MVEVFGLSDPGRKRRGNEDSMCYDAAVGLAVVADGMGGHQSGEVASRLAADTVYEFVKRATADRDLTWPFGLDASRPLAVNCLQTGIKLANLRVLGEAGSREEFSGMGTTVVAVLVGETGLTYAGVGDSRVYLYRRGSVRQLTRDDSWVEAAIAQRIIMPQDRDKHPFRHVLTKAIGLQDDLEFEIGEERFEPGDGVLLCSDGLTSVLSDEQIQQILVSHERDGEGACQALVDAANAGGGPDNVTVVLLRQR